MQLNSFSKLHLLDVIIKNVVFLLLEVIFLQVGKTPNFRTNKNISNIPARNLLDFQRNCMYFIRDFGNK